MIRLSRTHKIAGQVNKIIYHFLNGLFVLAALYFIYDSLVYLPILYKSVYDQSSLLVTVFVLFATYGLSIFGIALLLVPIANISRVDRRISIMFFSNGAAVAGSLGIVGFAVPALSGLLLALFG